MSETEFRERMGLPPEPEPTETIPMMVTLHTTGTISHTFADGPVGRTIKVVHQHDGVSTPVGTLSVERGCEMMLVGFSADEHSCGDRTVGGNGLYRYCARHLGQVAAAGGTVQRDMVEGADCAANRAEGREILDKIEATIASRPTRPDGFPQAKIDEIKTAMLATEKRGGR